MRNRALLISTLSLLAFLAKGQSSGRKEKNSSSSDTAKLGFHIGYSNKPLDSSFTGYAYLYFTTVYGFKKNFYTEDPNVTIFEIDTRSKKKKNITETYSKYLMANAVLSNLKFHSHKINDSLQLQLKVLAVKNQIAKAEPSNVKVDSLGLFHYLSLLHFYSSEDTATFRIDITPIYYFIRKWGNNKKYEIAFLPHVFPSNFLSNFLGGVSNLKLDNVRNFSYVKSIKFHYPKFTLTKESFEKNK